MESDNVSREPTVNQSNRKIVENKLNLGITEEGCDHREESGYTISRPWWESPPRGEGAADGLDWEQLGEELRNLFKFNAENRSWSMIVKTSLVIFAIRLAPSLFDMGTDAFSVYDFINGTTYTKYVPDLNHPCVNSSQCIHVGTYLRRNDNSSEVVFEEFECFERDPIWGYLSCVFIFLPGLLGGGCVWKGLHTGLCFLILPIFPFFVLTVKMIGLLNPGEN